MKFHIDATSSAKSVGAGIAIGIGCAANLLAETKIVGAVLFCVGLYTVLVFELPLFTGRMCTFDWRLSSAKRLAGVWLLNLIGALIAASTIALSVGETAVEKAFILSEAKIEKPLMSLFFLGLLCNLLIYIAVVGYKKAEGAGRWLGIMLSVTPFVYCGYEHCVADMVYFSLCLDRLSILDALSRLIVVTAGNVVGAIFATAYISGGFGKE